MKIKTTLDDVLAANLRQLKESGVFNTALELAGKAGMSDSTLGYIMQTKKREPRHQGEQGTCTLQKVEALARALEKHPIELLISQSEYKGSLLAAFEQVPDHLKENAVRAVLALAPQKKPGAGTSNKISEKAIKKDEAKPGPKILLVSNGD
jgi:hypothetical protein